MSDRTKVKVAFAEAIMQALWVKGLVTTKERDQIIKKTRDRLQKCNC